MNMLNVSSPAIVYLFPDCQTTLVRSWASNVQLRITDMLRSAQEHRAKEHRTRAKFTQLAKDIYPFIYRKLRHNATNKNALAVRPFTLVISHQNPYLLARLGRPPLAWKHHNSEPPLLPCLITRTNGDLCSQWSLLTALTTKYDS